MTLSQKTELALQGVTRWFYAFTGFSRVSGKPRLFYIEYFLYNPESGNSPFFSIKAGAWGEKRVRLHKIIAWKKMEVESGIPYSISAGEFFLSEDGMKGRMEICSDDTKPGRDSVSDSGFMSWCLTMEKHGWETSFTGEVILGDERFAVRPKDCNGYADIAQGNDLTGRLTWLHSRRIRNVADGKMLKASSFESSGGDGCVFLKIKGNPLRFKTSRFLPFRNMKCACRESQRLVIWHIEQRKIFSKIVIDISCRKREMILSVYDSMDGKVPKRKVWTGGNGSGVIRLWRFGRLVADMRTENVCCGLYSEPKKNEHSSKN